MSSSRVKGLRQASYLDMCAGQGKEEFNKIISPQKAVAIRLRG